MIVVGAAVSVLGDLLEGRLEELKVLPLPEGVVEPLVGADVWLLASALQKALRRGDAAMARRVGQPLLRMDRYRLWRRILTFAVEDVGIGDMELGAMLVGIASFPKLRGLLGGESKALDVALVLAGRCLKDRTADHLLGILVREKLESGHRALLKGASEDQLMDIVALPSQAVVLRARAAALLSGRYPDPCFHRGFVGDVDKALDVYRDLNVPEVLLAACRLYASRCRDGLGILLPLAFVLWRMTGEELRVSGETKADSPLIEGWPSYAFDPLHTRLGRRAVDLWLRSYLERPAYPVRGVAIALWNKESALCNRSLSWALGYALRKRSERSDLLFHGVPLFDHEALATFIGSQEEGLHCARKAAFDSAQRQIARGPSLPPALAVLKAKTVLDHAHGVMGGRPRAGTRTEQDDGGDAAGGAPANRTSSRIVNGGGNGRPDKGFEFAWASETTLANGDLSPRAGWDGDGHAADGAAQSPRAIDDGGNSRRGEDLEAARFFEATPANEHLSPGARTGEDGVDGHAVRGAPADPTSSHPINGDSCNRSVESFKAVRLSPSRPMNGRAGATIDAEGDDGDGIDDAGEGNGVARSGRVPAQDEGGSIGTFGRVAIPDMSAAGNGSRDSSPAPTAERRGRPGMASDNEREDPPRNAARTGAWPEPASQGPTMSYPASPDPAMPRPTGICPHCARSLA